MVVLMAALMVYLLVYWLAVLREILKVVQRDQSMVELWASPMVVRLGFSTADKMVLSMAVQMVQYLVESMVGSMV